MALKAIYLVVGYYVNLKHAKTASHFLQKMPFLSSTHALNWQHPMPREKEYKNCTTQLQAVTVSYCSAKAHPLRMLK
jgi:hypothetical protein